MNEGRAQCAFILHLFLSTIFCCPRFFAPLVYQQNILNADQKFSDAPILFKPSPFDRAVID